MTGLEKLQKGWERIRTFLTEGNTPVKIFFVVLSVFLWFLTKLSQDGYTETVQFPVSFKNITEQQSFGEKPLDEINVTITSQGFNILKYVLPNFSKLKINVGEVQKKDSKGRSYWLTNSSLELIENQLGPEVQVRAINPDTVFFDFQKLIHKKIPIKLSLKADFPKSRTIYKKPILKPDSIVISGPASVVNAIKEVITDEIESNATEDSISKTLRLQLPENSDLKFSHKKTTVHIEFTEITEHVLEIPVEIINLPANYQLKIFPEYVSFNFHVSIKDFNRVKPSDFRIYTDFLEIEENPERRFLNLNLTNYPDYIDNVNFEPRRVEYILLEK